MLEGLVGPGKLRFLVEPYVEKVLVVSAFSLSGEAVGRMKREA